jgi:hypothetical protein
MMNKLLKEKRVNRNNNQKGKEIQMSEKLGKF